MISVTIGKNCWLVPVPTSS